MLDFASMFLAADIHRYMRVFINHLLRCGFGVTLRTLFTAILYTTTVIHCFLLHYMIPPLLSPPLSSSPPLSCCLFKLPAALEPAV